MNNNITITDAEIERVYQRLYRDAEEGGYHLNPDKEFTKDLIRGLLINERRYGYWACPCRRAGDTQADDLDIICPCDYRDADLAEHDCCYCSLYVSEKILSCEVEAHSIPERRPPKANISDKQENKQHDVNEKGQMTAQNLPYPVWRCKVCGYLAARDNPPEVCPVCKAKKDRFEIFIPTS